MLNVLPAMLCVGLFGIAETSQAEEPKMAPIRRTIVETEIDGQAVEIRIRASGSFPVQQITSFDIWVGGHKVFLPKEAYEDLDNPNPASIDIRSPMGIESYWVPVDAQRPLASIAIVGNAVEWVSLILLENLVPVVALAKREGRDECLSLQPRWDGFCAKAEERRKLRESEAVSDN